QYSPQTFALLILYNDPTTTEIYTLSLHDALPISARGRRERRGHGKPRRRQRREEGGRHRDAVPGHRSDERGTHPNDARSSRSDRSEEHTSELQSRSDLVCRLLLEKKNKKLTKTT